MEDKAAEGRAPAVLEGQVFFSYPRHHVNVPGTGAWPGLGPLLQSSLQAHPAPPPLGSYSCALYLGTKTAHPSSTPSRGLAEMGSLPLSSGLAAPTQPCGFCIA